MVFHDLSAQTITPEPASSLDRNVLNIASVTDRLLASFFDFLILSPFVGLLLSFLIRPISLSKLLEVDESISSGFWLVYVVVLFLSTSFLMGIFLRNWQATPGQKFMQLQVVSYPSSRLNRKISLNQSLVRSFFWCFSWVFLGLPFLEILSHPLRRAIYERASDTLVVSQKKIKFYGPVQMEAQFIQSILKSVFIGVIVLIITYAFSIYEQSYDHLLTFKSKNELMKTCDLYADHLVNKKQRLDLLLALAYTKQIDEKCPNAEINRIFSSNETSLFSMAYVGRAILAHDDKISIKYMDLACERSSDPEACHLSDLLKSINQKGSQIIHSQFENKMIISKVVKLNWLIQNKKYVEALSLIKDLQSVNQVEDFITKKYVSIVWTLKKGAVSNQRRQPASVDTEVLFKEFESRFGVL